jgi:RHS repeat-associated protein
LKFENLNMKSAVTLTTILRRSTRTKQLVVATLTIVHLLWATPVLAQELAASTARASRQWSELAPRLAGDGLRFVQTKAARTVKLAKRAAKDLQRGAEKRRIKVNRTVPKVTAPSFVISFGADPSTDSLKKAPIFGEPLLPTMVPTADDNRALASLISGLSGTAMEHRLLRIDQFLAAHPASPWRASLLANTATILKKAGYFSRAAAYWDQAWELSRDSGDASAKAIADFALGESMIQMMTFGQVERLQQRFKDIEGRDVRGSAGAKVNEAGSGLLVLTKHHELALFSGPGAVRSFLRVRGMLSDHAESTIAAYHPTPAGTTMVDLQRLAASTGVTLERIHGAPIAEIPVPSIVHLRSQHFSAIVAKDGDHYILNDPALGGMFRMSDTALRDEASGYFLVADRKGLTGAWRSVPGGEAASVVGHCAPGVPSNSYKACSNCGGPGPGPAGMPQYGFHPVSASLVLEDVPIGYGPPVGPAVSLQLSYSHRDSRQPQTPNYGNVGPQWTFNALSYIVDHTFCVQSPCAEALVILRGQGKEGYLSLGQHALSRATLARVSDDPPRYERTLPDGTVEVFTQPDRPVTEYSRRVFLTEVIDPQGHTLTYTYDSSLRLVAITDAIGQVTTLAYEHSNPLLLTKVTDPFSRFAVLGYDGAGRLQSITDTANMTSSFTYGAGDFITAMTTPYGTTSFRHEANPSVDPPRIEATDPVGGTERLEFWFSDTGLSATESSSLVPTGFTSSNADLHRYVSLYWDKLAMARSPGDRTKAVATTWMWFNDAVADHHASSRNVPHSIKKPLENRVWYRYEGQSGRVVGNGRQPTMIGRVLDGGTSQITQMTYNSKGNVTSRIDPLGRQTDYTYATNGIDLLTVEQVRSGGTDVVQAYTDYTAHLPGTITDAAGQDTEMTYNGARQPLTVTNAKNETTTYAYDSNGYLETVTGPVSGATTTYTYDAYGRVESVEDADGYIVVTDYDHLNRLTQRTYPDETTETFTFNRLDLREQTDRLGRVTRHFYDGFGRRIATRDPAGRTISQQWCDCGSMDALIDANGNRTRWERDVQSRVTREIREDNTTDTLYTYDLAGRLKTVTDPKNQITTHSYNLDDSLSGTAYTDEEIETPNVSYTYDTYYARVATMVDGIGTTSYTYKAAGTTGAGQVAAVDGPLTNDTIAYTYDEVGRVTRRTINGSANQIDWTFDGLGRVTIEENLLGEFTYTYHGVTNRLDTVTYPNGQTSTFSYLDNEQDHRLETIHHKYPNASTLSKFDYTYDAAGNIVTWRQQADTTAVVWKYVYDAADQLISAVKHATDTPQTVLKGHAYAYDPAGNRTIEQADEAIMLSAYDNLNRLISQAPGGPMVVAGSLNEPGTVTVSGVPAVVDANNNFRGTVPTTIGTNTFTIVAKDATGNTTTQQYEISVAGSTKTFTYDANGNLTADGTRTFEWDARNQLLAVNVGTHRSEFTYDGDRRRVRIVEKESSVLQSDTKIIWCLTVICEERAADGLTVARRPFSLGEQVTGTAHFFTKDHLSSIGEVTDSASTLIARYAFDSWGRRTLVSGSNLSTVGFTGTTVHETSATQLTLYRAYDAELGRWLSEDPARVAGGLNMYAYVVGNPIRYRDPLGLVKWECSYQFGSAGLQVGPGGGALEAQCVSECVGQMRVRARVSALMVGASGGPFNAGLAISTIELEDPFAFPDANSLAGPSTYSSFGYGTPIGGWSATAMKLGAATGGSAGWGTYGADIGLDSYGGVSFVSSQSKE